MNSTGCDKKKANADILWVCHAYQIPDNVNPENGSSPPVCDGDVV